ncbi:unnamed protein product [Cylicocyclus nassatus]|uniref:Neurotransmitter-gated ion-channel ligand-binding domain-containing protein n=1 Tax=Cylicocyclus nassatus TaxID=53992 RepID=A0AA36GMR0_CYLNA|nr:unnamed protein product [Cylicocyclus nassatus]
MSFAIGATTLCRQKINCAEPPTSGHPLERIKPMIVNITLVRASLLSVDEPFQTVDMIDWNDARLVWNSSDFDDIEGFYINQNLIWKADIAVFNSRSLTDVASDAKHAYVKSSGDISLFVYNSVSFLCLMNVRNFPFDEQVCSIEFASYTFTSQELQLNCIMPKHYNSVSASNNEWIIDAIESETVVLRDSSDGEDYYRVKFIFEMRRFSIIYVVTIILPSFVLTFLCVLGMFWTKFDNSDYLTRIGCGLSAILAMCTVLQIAEQTIPKTRELPSLSIYIMVNLILVAIAISIVVMASKHYRFPKFSMCHSSKGWFHRLDFMFSTDFRTLCLLIFPVATVTNLLILIYTKTMS